MLEERNKIIEAALDEFVEVGFIDASLESIANRAQLDPAVARALFTDKEILLKELFKEKTEPVVSAVSLAVQEIEDPKELIKKTIEHLDRWLTLHPEVIRLYLRSLFDGSGVLESAFQQSFMPSELYERFEEMVGKRQVRCKNTFILALLLDSLMLFYHMMQPGMQMFDPDLSMEECSKMRLDSILDLLENGLYTS